MKRENFENIFKEVAEKHGVLLEEVRREMTKAIETAWSGNEGDARVKVAQGKVFCEGDIPTSEELIAYIVGRVITKQSDVKK